VVADPKLFIVEGEVWVTFNDGWSPTRNRLFIMRVTPRLGEPLECDWRGSQGLEKNWSFFVRDGSLKALYTVDPLRILTAPLPDDSASKLRFEEDFVPSSGERRRRRSFHLTIGSQAVEHNGGLGLIAHEKWTFLRWRSYFGRWVRICDLTGRFSAEVSAKRLYFSNRSLLGARNRHNKNLLSCTYFSGLTVEDDRALLGYGINDVSAGFSEVELSLL
jgi:hypothetical protein